MRLIVLLLIHDSILVGLILCRSWACSLGSCEFVCAMVSSHPANTVLLQMSIPYITFCLYPLL